MRDRPTTRWYMQGRGYEFCNCDFGCGCNFGGFPSSRDGSCQALYGFDIVFGGCGAVDLSGVKCAALLAWPKAIHQGHGTLVLIVEPTVSDAQVEALGEIVSGQLGGQPWELIGASTEIVGVIKAKITIRGKGVTSVFTVEGVGEGRGDTFKNPVTGAPHFANVELPDGFMWRRGECGQGSFHARAAGLSLAFDETNWIFYYFDWSNAPFSSVVLSPPATAMRSTPAAPRR